MTVESEVVRVGISELASMLAAAIGCTTAVILWIINRFQTKSNAGAFKNSVGEKLKEIDVDLKTKTSKEDFEKFAGEVAKRFEKNEIELKEFGQILHKIDKTVEYIKGRVEP